MVFQLTRELKRRSITKPAVRTRMIVIVSIRIDRVAGFCDRAPPMQIEQLVPHATVVALDDGVLDRLPRLDELERDAMLIGPGVEKAAAELGAIVDRDPRWIAALQRNLVESSDHAQRRQARVDLVGQPLAT